MSRRDFEEVWHERNPAAIRDIYRPDYRGNGFPVVGSIGRRGYRLLVTWFLRAFPDLAFVVHELDSADRYVYARWTLTGTQSGRAVLLPASGAHVELEGMGLHRYREGRVDETWLALDWSELVAQLWVGYADRFRSMTDGLRPA
jgi:predicted ester cyclase